MNDFYQHIATCIERGKVNRDANYPPDLKGQDGADEWTRIALEQGADPSEVLSQGLITGMGAIGRKFSDGTAFVPDLLMAAKAMKAAMAHLKPFFDAGQAHHKGTVAVGTVQGDLHDIGKNLVCMMLEGGGYKVLDLGVDVSPEKFVEAVNGNPGCVVGLSALLTTTMINMDKVIKAIRAVSPDTRVIVGGAPVNEDFARKIGADAYSPDPQGALEYLESVAAA